MRYLELAISVGFVIGLILFCASCGGLVSGASTGVAPGRDITAIQHTVFIIKENHTLDNYFGAYPGADGAVSGVSSTGQVVPLTAMPDVYQAQLCNGWSC